jgi:chromate transport protein ChrA
MRKSALHHFLVFITPPVVLVMVLWKVVTGIPGAAVEGWRIGTKAAREHQQTKRK